MTPTMVWIKMFGSILSAINFGVMALSLMLFLRRQDVGHRMLMRLLIIFCSMRSMVSLTAAASLYYHYPLPNVLMNLGTSLVGSICVVYFVAMNRDLIMTLRISELWDRLRKDKESSGEQARMQMRFVSEETLRRSEALLAARAK